MPRHPCTALLAVLVLALAYTPAAASTPGDANGDGTVNLFDLVTISLANNPAAPAADPRADVNGDGTVDVFDLVFVALRIVAVPPATPVGTRNQASTAHPLCARLLAPVVARIGGRCA